MSFWKNPQKKTLPSPEELRAAAVEYFDWADGSPLKEAKAFAFQGASWTEDLDKARVFTHKGLAVFVGITSSQLAKLRDNLDYLGVIDWIDDVIWTQKFELAAADLLNAGMISKDLGLIDKKSVEGGLIVQISSDDANL